MKLHNGEKCRVLSNVFNFKSFKRLPFEAYEYSFLLATDKHGWMVDSMKKKTYQAWCIYRDGHDIENLSYRYTILLSISIHDKFIDIDRRYIYRYQYMIVISVSIHDISQQS